MYAMVTRTALPADVSLLHGEDGLIDDRSAGAAPNARSNVHGVVHANTLGLGPAMCGITLVARGDVRLRADGGVAYKATMEVPLVWSNGIVNIPSGFSSAWPFMGHNHYDEIPAVVLQGMCTDDVPWSRPGEITVTIKQEGRERWSNNKEEELREDESNEA